MICSLPSPGRIQAGQPGWSRRRAVRSVALAFWLVVVGTAGAATAPDRVLVVGSEQDFPPFALGQTDATADGFTVELWRLVAKEQGIQHTIRVRSFSDLLEDFKAGRVDVMINLAQSDARREFADFTVPHVTLHGGVFVRTGEARIRTEADLEGKSIIVINADLAQDYAIAKGWQARLVPVTTAADGFKLLAAGHHDAMLVSQLAGMQTLLKLGIRNVKPLPAKAGFSQKFSFAVRKGEADRLARLNEGLALVKSGGAYDALYEKWFGLYEVRPVTLRDVLKYVVPLGLLLMLPTGWLLQRRQVERRRIATVLRESEERLRQLAETQSILDALPAKVVLLSPDGTIVAANQMWRRAPGVQALLGPQFGIGLNYLEICGRALGGPAGELQGVPEGIRAVLRGQAAEFIQDYPSSGQGEGEPRWFRLIVVPLFESRLAGAVAMHINVTALKQAEAVRDESRQLLEKAQQVGHIGSWVYQLAADGKATGRVIWSAETCRIYGLGPDEFDGRLDTFFSLVHPEDREIVMGASRAALASGRPFDFEYRIRHRDGRVRWVHGVADVERDEGGKPVRMTGVVQDITDRKQLEDQLRNAQKMEAIGQLAGGIAHDFNNILGAILGNVELALNPPPAEPVITEHLNTIRAASRRAADLVRQILLFSRCQEARRRPLRLEQVVKEALALLRASLPASIEFRTDLAPTWTVLADPSEIHQVTMNLCTNAGHAMRDRPGVLKVELANTQVDEAWARAHPDLAPGRYVRLKVEDNGNGMDRATLARIFEPFFTTKPVGEGTGLGLAVVHGVMKNHDGGVVVESRLGEGTAFHLYFPVFDEEVGEPPAAAEPVPPGRGERILFVDDEEPLTSAGKAALERMGYQVTPVNDPAEAFERFSRAPGEFEVLLTDLNMPGMSGAALAQKVRAIRPEMRLILTTGFNATLTEEVAREMGFGALLAKPYDLRSLGEAVHRVLNQGGNH